MIWWLYFSSCLPSLCQRLSWYDYIDFYFYPSLVDFHPFLRCRCCLSFLKVYPGIVILWIYFLYINFTLFTVRDSILISDLSSADLFFFSCIKIRYLQRTRLCSVSRFAEVNVRPFSIWLKYFSLFVITSIVDFWTLKLYWEYQ